MRNQQLGFNVFLFKQPGRCAGSYSLRSENLPNGVTQNRKLNVSLRFVLRLNRVHNIKELKNRSQVFL